MQQTLWSWSCMDVWRAIDTFFFHLATACGVRSVVIHASTTTASRMRYRAICPAFVFWGVVLCCAVFYSVCVCVLFCSVLCCTLFCTVFAFFALNWTCLILVCLILVCLILVCLILACSLLLQVCRYFPLKEQLRTLFKLPSYVHELLWEWRRATADDVMTDIYDTPRWRAIAGPPTEELTRILYQLCVDSFPWSSRKHQGVCVSLGEREGAGGEREGERGQRQA